MDVSTPLRTLIAALFTVTLIIPDAALHADPRPTSRKLDPALIERTRLGHTWHEVIIRTTSGQRDVIDRAVRDRGGRVSRKFSLVEAVTADVVTADLAALAERPDVLSISLDAVVQAAGAGRTTKKSTTKLTGTETPSSTGTTSNVQFETTQNYILRGSLGLHFTPFSGTGVGIAVIDSGIAADSVDFGNRISAFYDFTRGGRSATPTDAYGHGTHVAGLIAGSRFDMAAAGVADGARLVGLKVLDETGAGRTSHVIAALEFATANRASLGIHVVNLSLGHPIYEPAATDPLVQAVEAAVRAGLVVVVSAGNIGRNPTTGELGYAGITSPGNAPSAITVGALDTRGTISRLDDVVTPYSSRGPSWFDAFAKPDVVAPGHGLVATVSPTSTLATTLASMRVGSEDLRLNGTSMATAVTSGVVALMIEASRWNPANAGRALPPNAVKAFLQYSSIPVYQAPGIEYDLLTQGAGGLNGHGALTLASKASLSVAPGTPWITGTRIESSYLGFETLAWTRRLLWNDLLVQGDAPVLQLAGLGHDDRLGRHHRVGRHACLGRHHRVGRHPGLG